MPASKARGRLGAALQQALAGKLEVSSAAEGRAPGAGLFANAARARLFQALLDRPLSRTASLARATGLAPPSVRWHLAALGSAGLVRRADLPGNPRYFAPGTVEGEGLHDLAALRAPHAIDVLAAVARSPGLTLTELAREVLASPQAVLRAQLALSPLRFIEALKEGRHTRLYPGGALSAFVSLQGARLPQRFSHLEAALKAADEGVSVTRRARDEIVFQVGRRGARREFRLKAASALAPEPRK